MILLFDKSKEREMVFYNCTDRALSLRVNAVCLTLERRTQGEKVWGGNWCCLFIVITLKIARFVVPNQQGDFPL